MCAYGEPACACSAAFQMVSKSITRIPLAGPSPPCRPPDTVSQDTQWHPHIATCILNNELKQRKSRVSSDDCGVKMCRLEPRGRAGMSAACSCGRVKVEGIKECISLDEHTANCVLGRCLNEPKTGGSTRGLKGLLTCNAPITQTTYNAAQLCAVCTAPNIWAWPIPKPDWVPSRGSLLRNPFMRPRCNTSAKPAHQRKWRHLTTAYPKQGIHPSTHRIRETRKKQKRPRGQLGTAQVYLRTKCGPRPYQRYYRYCTYWRFGNYRTALVN